ncbi:MAG: 3-mercaptopyruvate sulfurtransferase [Rhodocyclaceae bacterium]|nr:3-mercaptopyruvate sulfurtransferase [Rhodocyclaceae bacterium]
MDGRYRTLIPAAVLAGHLDDPRWVVVDCRFALGDPSLGERHFSQSRIPGARYAHLDRDLSSPITEVSGRHPLPEAGAFARTLADLGITPDSQVVVYDDSFGSIAVRLWWLLRWAGHDAVTLLDGGWPAWKRHKLPLEEGPPRRIVSADSPYPVHPDKAAVVNAQFVDTIRLAPDWRLLDARPEERFTGERENIDPVAGHIPGSANRSFEDNLDFDGTFLPADELRESLLASLNGIPPEKTVHTCGSGVTACHNLLAMEHAGLPGSKLYAGSWSEWIRDSARPIAVGAG